MIFKQGDILLVPIPFSDLSSSKRRPVLVVSSNHYNQSSLDLIVVAITSNLNYSENKILLNNHDLNSGKLRQISSVRTDKIYTLSKGIILKKFGKVKIEYLKLVVSMISDLIRV